jgi:hypothetical protein
MDPTYPLVPFASFLTAFLLALALLASGLRHMGNRGVVMLSGWVLVMLLVGGVQTIVWADTAADVAPVFCDICMCILSRWFSHAEFVQRAILQLARPLQFPRARLSSRAVCSTSFTLSVCGSTL